jgi:hypothetical protein
MDVEYCKFHNCQLILDLRHIYVILSMFISTILLFSEVCIFIAKNTKHLLRYLIKSSITVKFLKSEIIFIDVRYLSVSLK